MKRYLLMCLMACLLFACREDEPTPTVTPDAEGATYMRITVDIAALGNTRSNPTGGEEGDGLITGYENETKIHDLTIFIYDDEEGRGLDNDYYCPIVTSVYVPAENLQKVANTIWEATFPVKDYTFESSHRLLVAANMGNLSARFANLGAVRNHIADRSWTPGDDIRSASRFAMATAEPKDGAISVVNYNVGDKEHPNFRAETSIERLAARIDIMAENNTVHSDHIKYTVTDKNGNKIADIRLTHATLINSMQRPSYMVKRVTPNTTDFTNLLYCGRELLSGDVPTNYVVDPYMRHKDGHTNPSTLSYWYGHSATSYLLSQKELIDWGSAALSNFTSTLADNTASAEFPKYFTLAYTNENTVTADLHTADYCTGLLLRTEYIPAKIYTNATCTDSITPTEAVDFYRYRPMAREFEEEKCLYFESPLDAQEYARTHPQDMAEVQKFTLGVAYYTVWIRHANDNFAPAHSDPFPMEFGIVRNNIYRIGFRFTGPGTPAPDIEQPHAIDVDIFVRKWNLREQSDIYM